MRRPRTRREILAAGFPIGLMGCTGSLDTPGSQFEVTGIAIPSEAIIGEHVEVEMTIENIGEADGRDTLELALDQQRIEDEISLSAGEYTTVTYGFDTTGHRQGESVLRITIDGQEIDQPLTLKKRELGFALKELTAPPEAWIGEELKIEYTVENVGNVARSTTATVRFAREMVAEDELTVPPSAAIPADIAITLPDVAEGIHPLAVTIEGDQRQSLIRVRDSAVRIHNPYEDVDWNTVEHHKCEFHNHPAKWEEPHRMVDLYHGSGEDENGNMLADGDEYTVFAVSDMGIRSICWPWTALSDIEGEDRDPEELGVVAFPGAEIRHSVEHFSSIFSTATDDEHDKVSRLDALQSVLASDTGVPEPLAVITHPERYYSDPDEDWKRYLDDFSTLSLEDGLVGIEALNHDSSNRGFGPEEGKMWDLDVWDHLLAEFMPDRPIWGYSVDDAGEFVIGEWVGIDIHWTELLLHPDEFDPSDQAGSRRAAYEAMRSGQFFGVEREPWDHDIEDPPPTPRIEEISVIGDTITITASDQDKIDWICNGDVVGSGESITVTEDNEPYVRAEVWNDDPKAVTITQPFGVTGR